MMIGPCSAFAAFLGGLRVSRSVIHTALDMMAQFALQVDEHNCWIYLDGKLAAVGDKAMCQLAAALYSLNLD